VTLLKKYAILLILLTVIIFPVLFSTIATKAYASNEKPIVVCTTSVLESIVKDLAGDRVITEVIASPAVCPAHYDVKPSDVDAFKEAKLIIAHGFEPWVKSLKEASGTKASIVYIKGGWNTPDELKSRYTAVASALKDYLGLDLSDRLNKCLNAIDNTKSWLLKFADENGFKDTPVICMLWQKSFIKFLGFKIVATYKPPELVSAKEYESIIKNGTSEHAILVIDNIQSGTDFGKKVANEVGAVEVALTNFPGVMVGTANVTEMMKYNAYLLSQGLKHAKLAEEVIPLKNEISLWRSIAIISIVVAVIFIITTAILVIRLRKA